MTVSKDQAALLNQYVYEHNFYSNLLYMAKMAQNGADVNLPIFFIQIFGPT